MLQSMTIANANVMHVDAILDSGATASIFPLNYHNLSKICKYPTLSSVLKFLREVLIRQHRSQLFLLRAF
jgi:hypothetical protein